MSYTPEQMAQIDAALRVRFQDALNVLCAEAAPHDFSRDEKGEYVQEHIFGMWAGYILNYMVIHQTVNGPVLQMREGLLSQPQEQKVYEPSSKIILL